MNIDVRKLDAQDVNLFSQLIGLFKDVFETNTGKMPPQDYLQQLLNLDSFLVFVALLEGHVIGGLTAHTLPRYDAVTSSVYLYDLAVSTRYQRQGVGKQLLTSLTEYCRRLGVGEVFVQADGDDTHAIDFYRSTGGISQKVIHFTYPLER